MRRRPRGPVRGLQGAGILAFGPPQRGSALRGWWRSLSGADPVAAVEWTARRSARFVGYATLLCFGLKIPLVALLMAVGSSSDAPAGRLAEGLGLGRLLLEALVIAPLFETAVGQAAPIIGLMAFTGSIGAGIAGSMLAFTALHVGWGWHTAVLTLAPALVLAVVFAAQLRRGWGIAFGMTAAVHFLHNLISVGLPLAVLGLSRLIA